MRNRKPSMMAAIALSAAMMRYQIYKSPPMPVTPLNRENDKERLKRIYRKEKLDAYHIARAQQRRKMRAEKKRINVIKTKAGNEK